MSIEAELARLGVWRVALASTGPFGASVAGFRDVHGWSRRVDAAAAKRALAALPSDAGTDAVRNTINALPEIQ